MSTEFRVVELKLAFMDAHVTLKLEFIPEGLRVGLDDGHDGLSVILTIEEAKIIRSYLGVIQ